MAVPLGKVARYDMTIYHTTTAGLLEAFLLSKYILETSVN